MDRHLFDQAIGTAPPSTVDVDAVVARQRRAALLRRAGPVTFAAATVVALTVGVIGLTGGIGSGTAPASPTGPTSVPTLSQLCVPGFDETPLSADLDADLDALSLALEAAVRAQLPGTQLVADPYPLNGGSSRPAEFEHVVHPRSSDDCWQHPAFLASFSGLDDAAGHGTIEARVHRLNPADPESELVPACTATNHAEPGFCELRTGTRGERVLVSTDAPAAHVNVTVRNVELRDGNALISLRSRNGWAGAGETVTRPEPNLTHDQLIEIALELAAVLSW